MAEQDSKERFSNRVETYVKFRPQYPKEALDYLFGGEGGEGLGIPEKGIVADVGAGTGIFTRLLLERGCRVLAVEPNEAMRQAMEEALGGQPDFRAVPGSAEATGLEEGAADAIVCAQSFHWFDREAARKEFRRILKPGGKVALIWNSRMTEGTPFREGYDKLLHTYCEGYEQVGHKNITNETLRSFFRNGGPTLARFPFRQELEFEGLKGRLLSSSYSPMPGHPAHEPMLEALRLLFDRSQSGGRISFDYETEVYGGEV